MVAVVNADANARCGKSMSLQQLLECGFDHGTSQVLNQAPSKIRSFPSRC